jgi:hypothetical protein
MNVWKGTSAGRSGVVSTRTSPVPRVTHPGRERRKSRQNPVRMSKVIRRLMAIDSSIASCTESSEGRERLGSGAIGHIS